MALFLIELLAILFFWKRADFSRMKELVPIVLTAMYLRFLEHFIVINWLKLWKIHSTGSGQLWIPLSADLTVWPIASYFFIQNLPSKGRLLYGAKWVGIMLLYLQLLMWFNIFSIKKGWNVGISALVISLYFTLIYFL